MTNALLRDRSGTVAVEFATVATLFLALLLFTLYLGFRLYVQVAVDYAAGRAARLLSVDSTQSRSSNLATFQAQTFCPVLAPFLACTNVTIGLWPVTDYLNGSAPPPNTAQPFNPGQGGSLMLLQIIYALPDFSWPTPDGTGATAMTGLAITSYYPYQNEY
jgi:Flp pilus assembly protein TadG